MLVVRVEIWPQGEAERARELGRVIIANKSRLAPVSRYEVTCTAQDGTRMAEVRHHLRADGWLALAARALAACAESAPI
jgi:hypothetical protein